MISDQLGCLFASLDMTAMFSALGHVTWPFPVLVGVGVFLGCALRRLLSIRCSVVAALFVGVLAAAVIVGPKAPELALAVDAVVGGDAGPAQSLLWAWSALLVLPAATIRMSVDERRARHAGNDLSHRGLRFFARVLRERVAEPPAPPRGSWRLGVDVPTRERVEVDVPKTTTLIVGGAGQGKTNTVLGEVEAAVRNGYSVAFCDGKGSKDVALTLLVVAEALNVPFHVVSPREYGTPALDRRRRSLNVMADLSPEQVRDLVALAEEQTEPYYRNINKQGSRAAAAAIQVTGGVVTLKTLARALRQPEVVASALQQADAERFAEDVEWLSTLPAREKESLRALAGRLRNLSDGPAGDAITDGLPEVRLAELLQGGGGILYINAAPEYPDWSGVLTRYLVEVIGIYCGRIDSAGIRGRCQLIFDELGNVDGARLGMLSERTREAGVPIVISTQSLSNLMTVGGRNLYDACFNNAALIIVHCQRATESVDDLVALFGEREVWEVTEPVGMALWFFAGRDRSTRRRGTKPNVHGDELRSLRCGEAFVYSPHLKPHVRRVRIKPFIPPKDTDG